MKYVFILIIPLLGACATHAPMSEMVMFNKATIADSSNNIRSGSLSYLKPGINLKEFEENEAGDYASYSDTELPSFTIHTFTLKNDRSGRSLSFGRGLGIDWTKNLRTNYYGTLALSAPYSAKITIHRVLVNRRWTGLSSGIFSGLDSKIYNSNCVVGSVCEFWPNRSAFLFNTGLRTRYLIRDPRSPGLVLTGAFEFGYIWNSLQPFIGFNISITSLE